MAEAKGDATGESAARRVDVLVIGTGSGGKAAALALAADGRRVLAVESGRVGGECPYVACVPAKSLLLSAREGRTWVEAVEARDDAADHREDRAGVQSLREAGVDLVRGRAVLSGPGQARVSGTDGEVVVHAGMIVLAPGSRPSRPPVDGLEAVPTWTSDEALSAPDRPERLLVLGGGAVGCELAQAFAGLGSRVVLIEVADRLLPAEQPWVGGVLADALRSSGVEVRTGVEVQHAAPAPAGVRLELDDGSCYEGDRVLIAGGRAAATDGLGVDVAGGTLTDSGEIRVDARCRVLDADDRPVDGLYALGDATPDSAYTHSATYQARILSRQVRGDGVDADYRAIPRVAYTDPAVFCVGVTEADAGVRVLSIAVDVADVERAALWTLARPQRKAYGRMELLVGPDDVVLGAACVGPEADSWAAELALAVRLRMTATELREQVHAFPAWSETITAALDQAEK